VNLRPSAPPVPLLFALLVLVAASARFGAQTLAELSGDAQAQLWGIGAMWTSLAGCGSWLLIMLVIAYVNLARPLPLPPRAVTPEPVMMASEVEADFQPDLVFIPMADGTRPSLHITPKQLKIFKARIRKNKLGLPINGTSVEDPATRQVIHISSTAMIEIRAEALKQRLARDRGSNIIEWTAEGAVGILRASPAPIVEGAKHGQNTQGHAQTV
jgi:hypothetical protein